MWLEYEDIINYALEPQQSRVPQGVDDGRQIVSVDSRLLTAHDYVINKATVSAFRRRLIALLFYNRCDWVT